MVKRSEREAQGVCVVEGVRAVTTALESGADVEALYVAADAGPDLPPGFWSKFSTPDGENVLEKPVRRLAPGVLERVADTVTPQAVLAVVRVPTVRLEDLDDVSLVVVLAEVRDPGNAGAVVRVAEGAGASAVVFARGSADAFSPKVVRASAGAVFQVPVVTGRDTGEVLDVLAQRGVRRLGTAASGGEPYDRVDWTSPTALVLGNEAWGVPDDVRDHLDGWTTIPMAGHAKSLNVATAASVLLFEAARQRRDRGPSGPARRRRSP